VKQTLRAHMVEIVLGALMFAILMVPHSALANGDERQPVCLSVADGRNALFTLTVQQQIMLSPPPYKLRVVKALTNNAEPALGVAYNGGQHTLVNLQGTVAGFFTAMQFTYNPKAGVGTGRVVEELQSHQSVTVTKVSCQ
jgi:hypothetical protein